MKRNFFKRIKLVVAKEGVRSGWRQNFCTHMRKVVASSHKGSITYSNSHVIQNFVPRTCIRTYVSHMHSHIQQISFQKIFFTRVCTHAHAHTCVTHMHIRMHASYAHIAHIHVKIHEKRKKHIFTIP